ncbi:hypothetical protein AAVH_36897 [Aphelenchoides avenae]|nr:hypothetical protein AAVH_36897 [Aphelenchus avenae]
MCLSKFKEWSKKVAQSFRNKFGKKPSLEPTPVFHFAEGDELVKVIDYVPDVESAKAGHTPRVRVPPPTPPTTKTVYLEPKEATERSTLTFASTRLIPMPRRGASKPQKLRDAETRRHMLEEVDASSDSDPIFKGSPPDPHLENSGKNGSSLGDEDSSPPDDAASSSRQLDTPVDVAGSSAMRQERTLPSKNTQRVVRFEREFRLRLEGDRVVERYSRELIEYDF